MSLTTLARIRPGTCSSVRVGAEASRAGRSGPAARSRRNPCDGDTYEIPAPAFRKVVNMAVHGTSVDGAAITDEAVEVMADEAEQGYYVGAIQRRRGGRPPIGSAASSVESVRLDPELKRELLLCAAEEHISVSEAVRRAIGQYVRAR